MGERAEELQLQQVPNLAITFLVRLTRAIEALAAEPVGTTPRVRDDERLLPALVSMLIPLS